MIIIESQNGTKFGALIANKIHFNNNILESYKTNDVVLFNITNKRIFPVKDDKIHALHTNTGLLGIHPRIYFA
jgi:hypothetical protein